MEADFSYTDGMGAGGRAVAGGNELQMGKEHRGLIGALHDAGQGGEVLP